jgi:hypothetical protein
MNRHLILYLMVTCENPRLHVFSFERLDPLSDCSGELFKGGARLIQAARHQACMRFPFLEVPDKRAGGMGNRIGRASGRVGAWQPLQAT